MKKIIYSVVLSIILSITFLLISPTWFLQGDARWTYPSNTARIDISFIGNLKGGTVKVEGVGIKATQPRWLSSDRFQGTSIEFPVSYRKKAYKIKITPQADAMGNDPALILTFRGSDIRQGEKKMPAWVTFRNISLNGEITDLRQKVQHKHPFKLKCSPHTYGITLAFDVHKPLKISDFSYIRFLVTFSVFLLLSVLVTPLKSLCSRILDYFPGALLYFRFLYALLYMGECRLATPRPDTPVE